MSDSSQATPSSQPSTKGNDETGERKESTQDSGSYETNAEEVYNSAIEALSNVKSFIAIGKYISAEKLASFAGMVDAVPSQEGKKHAASFVANEAVFLTLQARLKSDNENRIVFQWIKKNCNIYTNARAMARAAISEFMATNYAINQAQLIAVFVTAELVLLEADKQREKDAAASLALLLVLGMAKLFSADDTRRKRTANIRGPHFSPVLDGVKEDAVLEITTVEVVDFIDDTEPS